MYKIALIVWMVLGTTLAGIGIMVVVSDSTLSADAMKFIPIAAAIGFVVALPLAYLVAKRILVMTHGR